MSHCLPVSAARAASVAAAQRRNPGHPGLPLSLTALAWAAAWALLLPRPLQAQVAEAEGQSVIVTGSPRAQRLQDAPFAASVVDARALREAGPMVNLSEALVQVPGLVANSRQNYAQDLQLSSRGFGARASFGVRGLRLYTDGIPATMPDGQGQVAHFDLAGAERIEVLRGPFSVLYGNSSGGVISVFTAPVRERTAEAAADLGSFGLRQVRAGLAMPLAEGLDLRAGASRFEIEGARDHTAASRTLAQARLGWRRADDRLTLLVSHHRQDAQDPLGLTPAQFAADARQTDFRAAQFNTRKWLEQNQVGFGWLHRFDAAGALKAAQVSVYAGTRSVNNFLAIPATVQAAATHGGGAVDFDRRFHGADARLEWQFGGADLAAGLTWETQRDDRRGFASYTGPAAAPTALGVQGVLKRNELNEAVSREAYLQGQWPIGAALALTGGLRTGTAELSAEDRFLSNGNDSGRLSFRYTNPVLGLRWTLSPGWSLHGSAARGFESPTLGELAYAPATQTEAGFNRGLKGQSSRQFELGSKWRGASGAWADAAVFLAETANEIGVLSNTGGRTVFQNVGRTQRKGAELAGGWRPMPELRLQMALTWLDARYRDAFSGVRPGNRIAGTARASGWAQAAWKPGLLPGELALEWRGTAAVAANDLNTVQAPGHALVNLRWSHTLPLGARDRLELLARVDNLADRVHVGSVIVNEGNSRFFEPGLPRNALLSMRWVHRY